MKVLMFGWEYPPLITGGLGTACYGLSQSLSRLVEKITFVLPKIKTTIDSGSIDLVDASDVRIDESTDASRILRENIDIITIKSKLKPYITSDDYQQEVKKIISDRQTKSQKIDISGNYGDSLYDEVVRYGEVAGAIAAQDDYDVIHAHDWMTFYAGIKAKKTLKKPLIVHIHALEHDRCGDQNVNPDVYFIEKHGMVEADRIIAVSERTKGMIVKYYGINPDKISVVHNGVLPLPTAHARRTNFKNRDKLVVFLGRITMQKGPEYFLEAAYQVLKKVPNVRFVMAGTGDLFPRMVLRMAELRLADRFHFTGFLNDAQRDRIFSMADLFVMTSVSEPFGLTPLEALQHDVPLIISKQAGVCEVLKHAVKVDFWDVRKIANAIINVLTHESLSRQMVEGGRLDIEAINWENGAKRVVEIYKEMI